MDQELLKRILTDNQRRIGKEQFIPRAHKFDPLLNYLLLGPHRAGKSAVMRHLMHELVQDGVAPERIICIDFEDERLAEFGTADFNALVLLQSELSDESGYFFFEEIQHIPNWEKFCRRLADAGERVYVSCSADVEDDPMSVSTMGGRFLTRKVYTLDFAEYLTALECPHDRKALLGTRSAGVIRRHAREYLEYGGFPELLVLQVDRREHLSSVNLRGMLYEIVARHDLRNAHALRVLIKKIAESVGGRISFSKIQTRLKDAGISLSKDCIIDYVNYAEEAFLLFEVSNFCARFAERESNPKLYFGDNGLLNLYLTDGEGALLENAVALALKSRYEEVWYFKSSTTGIDIDFYIPDAGLALQVAWSVKGEARKREINNLVKFAKGSEEPCKLMIVTFDEEERISLQDHEIEVVPLVKFLLGYDGRKRGK